MTQGAVSGATSHLDHLVVTAPTLAAGAAWVERCLGIAPGPGRQHPHMGTHNLLLSLGATLYLEVIAIDPQAPPPSRPRWFGLDHVSPTQPPRLSAWVANTTDIHAHASPALGAVEQMTRDGLSWQMTVTPDGRLPLSGAAPLLIQRATTFHPAARLPDLGLRLRRLHIRHPDPARVDQVLAGIGLVDRPLIAVTPGAVCALGVEIETPAGVMALGDIQ